MPQPYYAILVADGDRMGKLIGAQDSQDRHRELSIALAEFAKSAAGIVKRHHGHPVYSGGDDVVAFLPVNRAIDCAAQLRRQFLDRMQVFETTEIKTDLSAGIAIVHHLERLQSAVKMGHAALDAAKHQGRESLAVSLNKRGGASLTVARRWDGIELNTDVAVEPDAGAIEPGEEHIQDAHAGWQRWINAFRNGLAHGLPYELQSLAREFKHLPIPKGRIRPR